MILAGLWVGDGSPRMDVYLKPFIKEITQLHEEGIMCPILKKGNVNIKVHTLIAILDSTARPKVNNIQIIYQ